MHHFPNMTQTERVSLYPYLDTFVATNFIDPARQMGYCHDFYDTKNIGTKEVPKWVLEKSSGDDKGKITLSVIWYLQSPSVKEPYIEVESSVPGAPVVKRKLDMEKPSESFRKILEECHHI